MLCFFFFLLWSECNHCLSAASLWLWLFVLLLFCLLCCWLCTLLWHQTDVPLSNKTKISTKEHVSTLLCRITDCFDFSTEAESNISIRSGLHSSMETAANPLRGGRGILTVTLEGRRAGAGEGRVDDRSKEIVSICSNVVLTFLDTKASPNSATFAWT